MSERYYEAEPLECPCLRWEIDHWIAINEDPCPTKKCHKTGCHNYGHSFDDHKRLIVMKEGSP